MEDVLRMVAQLEQIRKVPQFLYVAGIYKSKAHKVRTAILDFKKKHPEANEIDFILESGGGSPDFAYVIIRTLREHFEKVNIIIAFWAKSAATLLAFGGTDIYMDEFAEFGPLDMQLKKEDFPDAEFTSALIDEYSLGIIEERGRELYKKMFLDILKDKQTRITKESLSKQLFSYIPSLYKPLLSKIDPYEIGKKARALAVGERYAERILTQFNKQNVIDDDVKYFIDYIVHECPDHRFVIDYSLISQFLKNVHKASELSQDYCEILTNLSMYFFNRESQFEFIGFVDKKVLEKKEELGHSKTVTRVATKTKK